MGSLLAVLLLRLLNAFRNRAAVFGHDIVSSDSKAMFNFKTSGPALGMFELFGRTGPPILGGRLFGR